MTEQVQPNPYKDSLKVQALTERISTVVAQYEEQMAEFRAQSTIAISERDQKINDLTAELEALKNQAAASVVQEEDPDAHPE